MPNQQIPLPISLGEKSSFDNFWVGENQELVTALKTSVQTGQPNLIYLYGPQGSGKSHLLFAAMRYAKSHSVQGTYLSLSDPSLNNFEQATALLEMVAVNGLVCIDDAQAWAGDAERERALFAMFEQIKHAGGQLLIAGHRAPELLGVELKDLISRLASGLIYALEPLDDEHSFQAIKLRNQETGLRMEDEVVRYLLTHTQRSTHQIFELLEQLDHASLAAKRRITIPFLRSFITQA